MTRFLIFLLLIISGSASAQTYVRPSKGNAITPFSASSWTGFPLVSGAANIVASSPPYDWSAFDAVRIYAYSDGPGNNLAGEGCTRTRYSYTVSGMGPYIKIGLRYRLSTGVLSLTVSDSATVGAANYYVMSGSTTDITALAGCNVRVSIIPLAFAPPKDTISVSLDTDAGVDVTVISTEVCTTTRSANTSVGTSATAVPADGGLSGRQWVRLCNSVKNSGVPILTCSTGVTPDAGLNGIGEALEVGDCSVYPTSGTVTCISDTAGTSVSSEECQ